MTWRYVVMANGKGLRWGNHLGIPKHLITVGNETLVQRIVSQVHLFDSGAEIVISSSDPRCIAEGASRHVPVRSELEIDRFVPELITDQVCFLYGDTYYTDESLGLIVEAQPEALHFFETDSSIVALKSGAQEVLRAHLARVRKGFLAGAIGQCKGWDVLASYLASLPPDVRVRTHVGEGACDFNTPEDLIAFARVHADVRGGDGTR